MRLFCSLMLSDVYCEHYVVCLPALAALCDRYMRSSPRRPEGPWEEVLPWWLEQAQDWEAAAAVGAQPMSSISPDPGRLLPWAVLLQLVHCTLFVCGGGSGRNVVCAAWQALSVGVVGEIEREQKDRKGLERTLQTVEGKM
jgi:hypothetical protein